MSPALFLSACLLGGLLVGAVLPLDLPVAALTIPALAVQTLITVGGLPPLRRSGAVRDGLVLLLVHHATLTVPLVVVALLVGVDTPIGFGIYVMAVAPPAAVTPAYAETAGVDARPVLAFCLTGYATGVLLTPALVGLVVVGAVDPGLIAYTLIGGLVLPTIAGRSLSRVIRRVPEGTRRALVGAALFVVTLGLGGGVVEGLRPGGLGVTSLLLVVAVVVGRTFGSGALAVLLSSAQRRDEAPFAGAFKNIALAAAVAAPLAGPVASIPALASFPAEAAYFLYVARRGGRSAR